MRETGCWGVAEGAALAAVGAEGVLLVPKRKGERVTCAIALAPRDLQPATHRPAAGQAGRGGPGTGRAALAHERSAASSLAEAEELVGYGLYLDLIGPAAAGKPRHEFPLGAEVERCRFALALAAEGRVGGAGLLGRSWHLRPGDLGVRASGKRQPIRPGRASPITVSPGVSALQAAAAVAGAPLGHDFCAISLSDLLTPVEVIEQRVRAAAAGDFVIAFYNPVSQRRRELLGRAREILLEHRPPGTPVVLARNLGRPDQTTAS